MNDLIEKRDKRTKRRKEIKKKMDSIIGLSYHDKEKKVMSISLSAQKLTDNKARLIDEGYIDNGFVIKKGALEKYLNGKNEHVRGWEFDGEEWVQTEVLNLTDDFVGTVNIGHMDFATFPILPGEWTKNDLTLVDTENDRRGLDINVRLNENLSIIQDLKQMPYDIGVSAEFWTHTNEADTEALSEMLGYYMPVFDEIYIFAYALVGECGNVNSSGLELGKDFDMKGTNQVEINLEFEGVDEVIENLEQLFDDTEVEVQVEEVEEVEATDEATEPETDEDIDDATVEPNAEELSNSEDDADANSDDETDNEVDEVADEEVQDEQTDENETGDEDVVDEASDSDEDDSEEADDELAETLALVKDLTAQVQALSNQVAELTEANAKLKKTNRKLSSKYQGELDKKAKFKEELKGISVGLLPDEDENETNENETELKVAKRSRSGIGEI